MSVNSTKTRGLVLGISVMALAYLALPGEVTAQRGESQGRLPFQTTFAMSLDHQSQVYRRFAVARGRRLEILNVSVELKLSALPIEFDARCMVNTPGQFAAFSGAAPILFSQRVEPRGLADPPSMHTWLAAQPTLLHASAGQSVTCWFNRFPVTGAGYIEWTVSGFTDEAQ
jgi:hypothetical protein